MRKKLLIVGLMTMLCLSGCSKEITPMVEDEVSTSEIKLSDEQMEILTKSIKFVRKHPCVTGPVLPSRITPLRWN